MVSNPSRDDRQAHATAREQADRRDANRAVAVSALGLLVTGSAELVLALATGSVGLLGDALHNLSDVSTSLAVFVGFRVSRRQPSERFPFGYDRAEDLAGLLVAVVIWLSAALALVESVHKLLHHGGTSHVGIGMAGAVLGIVGNQVVAAYKLRVGRRIHSNTLVADARHSWLDALSSVGALVGLILVASGQRWGDPLAGLAVTGFIAHVGLEVTRDVSHHLMDGVEPAELHPVTAAVTAAVPALATATCRGRWSGRALLVELRVPLDGTVTVGTLQSWQRAAERAAVDAVPAVRSLTVVPV